MGNIIKICDILFYTDIMQSPVKTAQLLMMLQTNKIGNYHIIDGSHNPDVLDQLRTMSFGLDFQTYPSLKLPVVTWVERYDDYERIRQVAQTPNDLLPLITFVPSEQQ